VDIDGRIHAPFLAWNDYINCKHKCFCVYFAYKSSNIYFFKNNTTVFYCIL